jgi:hypothetical protein
MFLGKNTSSHGGNARSQGGISPLTYQSYRGTLQRSHQDVHSGGGNGQQTTGIQDTIDPLALTPIPLTQPDNSSLATMVISVLEDSYSDPTAIKESPLYPGIAFIKDKPSDLGLKEVTGKQSRMETKKGH